MKNLKAPFLAVTLILLNVSFMLAGSSNPPAPTAKVATTANTSGALDDECEDFGCNPTFPIDQNIVFLVIGGLALGAAVIYKNQTKKASI